MHAAVPVAFGWLAGAVPFSYLVARRVRGVDLREHGHGTVSGSALYEVAGFGPLVVGGVLDVAKGAVGPLLARDRPMVAAVAAVAAVAGHNWSPFLKGEGGRGISPAMGGLAVVAPPGAVILLSGLGLGKLARHTGLGSFLAQCLLVPTVGATHGRAAVVAASGIVAALWLKRMVGNRHARRDVSWQVYVSRLVFDHDDGWRGRGQARAERTL